MTTTFPRSSPSALGIDAGGVLAFVRALETTPDVEPHSLMLLRHGQVVAEGWWAPYRADRVHLLYSLSKSFTAAAVGIAVGEGLVDLDATVLSYFPELDADITDERSRRILVRHVLAMASGHSSETVERARELDPDNLVRGFLLLPPDEEPGTVFAYNQPCTYSLGAIVRRVSGGSLLDYLRPRLLGPLGIDDVAWVRDDTGAELGFSGLHATTSAIAALGQLYLQRGVWDGTRILSEEWVEAATQLQVRNDDEENPDWSQGYGFQFWMARHGFRGDGAYGQFCVMLPGLDVVLAMTGQSIDMQAVLDAAWEHLLPAIGDGPVSAGPDSAGPDSEPDSEPDSASSDDVALASALADLALPAVAGGPLDALVVGARLDPGDDNAVSSLTAVEISRVVSDEAPGPDGVVRIALVEGTTRLEVEVGEGRWSVDGPLGASGALDSASGTVVVDVRFLDTPHLLHVRCAIDATSGGGTFAARWATEPLHSDLAHLRRPTD
ncbi:serine hydrolase domain-containing protein [Curtobacterium sp. Leaf261]|uniref:serine hydrolase domain-containing protein n=1 Tax=Curtobacterium sp. Leaf261 TaxID=1736311 RepID=UPI0006F53C2B|nr:serine hydrolase domain-containing protein [Curtobacterium sp. Leaf261]KQO60185.1 serine hydrolase [Curtobacterium sp. Leaf261]